MNPPSQHSRVFQASLSVLKALRDEGHEAFFAGGAVRDMLLGVVAKDFDIATSAPPDTVIALFEKTVEVGAQFGVIRVLQGGYEVEVATFRTEGGYADGRHPDQVSWTSAKDDVLRRDFTINGLLWDPLSSEGAAQVIDYVDGQEDLRAGVIRAIGDAEARFAEDRLRILRAIRFAARLGFDVEEQTWQALLRCAGQIHDVSVERIFTELNQMLTGSSPVRAWALLEASTLLTYVLPEVTNPLRVAERLAELQSPSSELVWAVVLLDAADQRADVLGLWAKRLKTSNALARHVQDAVRVFKGLRAYEDLSVADRKRLLRDRTAQTAIDTLRCAVRAGQVNPRCLTQLSNDVAHWVEADLRPPLLLDGNQLIAMGHPKGPSLGATLRALEDAQLAGRVANLVEAEHFISERIKGALSE